MFNTNSVDKVLLLILRHLGIPLDPLCAAAFEELSAYSRRTPGFRVSGWEFHAPVNHGLSPFKVLPCDVWPRRISDLVAS